MILLTIALLTQPAEVAKAEQAERGAKAGLRVEDPYLKIDYDPVRFPNNAYGLYKRIILKQNKYSLIPIDTEGNIYLTLVQEFTGEIAVRAPLSATPGEEFLGNLHLETSLFSTLRPCYLSSAKNLPPLPKDAIGYLKLSPKNLRKLAKTQNQRGIICKDANIYLALLQNAISHGGDTWEILPKKSPLIQPKPATPDDGRIDRYLQFLKSHPKLFHKAKALLYNREEILESEGYEHTRLSREFGEENIQPKDYQAGIVYQDRRLTWVRFPLRFADGSLGLKNEIIQTPILRMQELCGAGVLAHDSEGKTLLLGIYRVATRANEAECSKGAKEPDEDFVTCAAREAREELRRPVQSINHLGITHTGLDISTLETYPVYAVRVGDLDESIPNDPFEGIQTHIYLTINEIQTAYKRGYLEKEGVKYTFADPLLAISLILSTNNDL
ncbi:MAG: hypothetical protein ChlgKO_06500 [Chlamydiales bacterium]